LADVSAAREMVVAQADAAIENAAVKEEDDFLQRLMNKFSGPEPQEVSLEHIQKTLRKSRREGARSPAELIKALEGRNLLQSLTRTRSGPTNGRQPKFILIPPQHNPVGLLLAPASAESSTD